MCGRYAFNSDPADVQALFRLAELPAVLTPRYNVAPSQLVAVVGPKPGSPANGLVMMRWGFVPRWASDPAAGPRPINAKAETIATNPAFRDSFRHRRCLIPADGFYEWEKAADGRKVPHYVSGDGGLLAFAGVWDVWKPPAGGPPLYTVAVVTTAANDRVRFLHERMPAIIPREDHARWLDNRTPSAALLALLRPYPADRTRVVRVGPAVNKATNEGPACVATA